VRRAAEAIRQQFDAFRGEYNTERPHEALCQETPGSRYRSSRRAYPATLPVSEYPEYPGHFLVKHVTDAGTFRFQQRLLYIANALVDQHIGLEETDAACGRSTSTPCSLRPWMSATTSSAGNPERVTHVLGEVLPMSSAAQ
jgi:hypothetical protein